MLQEIQHIYSPTPQPAPSKFPALPPPSPPCIESDNVDPHRPELQRDDVVPPGRPHAQPVAWQRRGPQNLGGAGSSPQWPSSLSLFASEIRAPPATGALGSGPRISALSHGELTFAGATARFPELCAIGFKYPVQGKTLHRYTHSHQFQIRISIPTTDRAKSNASPAYTARRSFAQYPPLPPPLGKISDFEELQRLPVAILRPLDLISRVFYARFS